MGQGKAVLLPMMPGAAAIWALSLGSWNDLEAFPSTPAAGQGRAHSRESLTRCPRDALASLQRGGLMLFTPRVLSQGLQAKCPGWQGPRGLAMGATWGPIYRSQAQHES